MFETEDLLVREYFRKIIGEYGLNIMKNVPDNEIART